jgi:hypothetical protein
MRSHPLADMLVNAAQLSKFLTGKITSALVPPSATGRARVSRLARQSKRSFTKLRVASIASCQRSSDAAWFSWRLRNSLVTAASEALPSLSVEPCLRIKFKNRQRFGCLSGRKTSRTMKYLKDLGRLLCNAVAHARPFTCHRPVAETRTKRPPDFLQSRRVGSVGRRRV